MNASIWHNHKHVTEHPNGAPIPRVGDRVYLNIGNLKGAYQVKEVLFSYREIPTLIVRPKSMDNRIEIHVIKCKTKAKK